MTLTEIPVEITAAVSSTARQLRAKYRDYCELEDIQQELFIWYVKSHRKVAKWQEEHHPKSVQRLVGKSLRNAGERYCRREKARVLGHEPEDEFFYTIPMVADMLQLHFDPDWTAPRGIDYDRVTTKGAPSDGMNLVAMVADVGKEFEQLSDPDRALLAFVYDGSRPVRDAITILSLDWNITPNAADHRVRRVLGRIRSALGGPSPYVEESE